jgi:hypothetical protein
MREKASIYYLAYPNSGISSKLFANFDFGSCPSKPLMQFPASLAARSLAVARRLRGLRSKIEGKTGEQNTPRKMNLSNSSLFYIFHTTHSDNYFRRTIHNPGLQDSYSAEHPKPERKPSTIFGVLLSNIICTHFQLLKHRKDGKDANAEFKLWSQTVSVITQVTISGLWENIAESSELWGID